MEYRIRKHNYYDEYGHQVKDSSYYYVQFYVTFLWGLIGNWVTVTHRTCGWGDCYQTMTRFKTEEEAQEFISKRCAGKPINKGVEITVGHGQCS